MTGPAGIPGSRPPGWKAHPQVMERLKKLSNEAASDPFSMRLKLSAPFGQRIAEPLDADAAGQATFYGRFDKIGCEEGE